jgi:dihydrolipoamide dehydrogenase
VSKRYDLAIVGGGPAGYVGAVRAAQLGGSVAAIEARDWGGTCLNRGCIPSKALIHACETIELAREGKNWGVTFGDPALDWDALRKTKSRVVQQLVSGVELLLDGNKVTKIAGRARLLGDGRLQVTSPDGSQEVLEAASILIATGSVPWCPPFPGHDLPGLLSSDEAVDAPGPYASLAIVGGGAIGCEFAYIYALLGAKVTIVEMMPQLVPTEDADAADALFKSLRRLGVKVLLGSKVTSLQDLGDRKRLEHECGGAAEALEAEQVLLAVGRRADIDDLGLEEAGVERGKPGIVVDDHLKTTADGIYAAGDCLRGVGLAHLASHEAVAAVETILGDGGHVNYDCVPAAIFTRPEVSSVGLKEKQAAERGIPITVGAFPMSANSRATATRQRDGFVKLIAAADSGQLLGACIVGPCASELIATCALAVEMGVKAVEVADTIHSHPTFAEAIHEAALDVLGRAIHIPPKKS